MSRVSLQAIYLCMKSSSGAYKHKIVNQVPQKKKKKETYFTVVI